MSIDNIDHVFWSLGGSFDGGDDFEAAEKFTEDRTLGADVRGQGRIRNDVTANSKWVRTHIDARPPASEVMAPSEAGRIEKLFWDERVGRPDFC